MKLAILSAAFLLVNMRLSISELPAASLSTVFSAWHMLLLIQPNGHCLHPIMGAFSIT